MEDLSANVETLYKSFEHLKNLQTQMFDTMNVLIENQKYKLENESHVIHNQGYIIRNQEVIVKNQVNIINNQKLIVENQVSLDVIVHLQTNILHKLNNMAGNVEDIADTAQYVNSLREASMVARKHIRISDPTYLQADPES